MVGFSLGASRTLRYFSGAFAKNGEATGKRIELTRPALSPKEYFWGT